MFWFGLIALIVIGSMLSTASKKQAPSTGKHLAADDHAERLRAWRERWDPLIDRRRWIPSGTAARILSVHPAPEQRSRIGWFSRKGNMQGELEEEFRRHNQEHRARQKIRLKPFFDSVEINPLTEEQIDACICMDDNVQIVAAAGSGKTSTMVAKAAYVLHEHIAAADQILLLAFNKSAADELRMRIRARLTNLPGIEAVTASTFHAFGLHVIAQATGRKPSLARWLDEPGDDLKMIAAIAEELAAQDARFRIQWLQFRTIYGRDIGSWNEPNAPEVYRNGRRGFATAMGDVVKSKEERLIADWLFYHGVRYQYERDYEHETATEHHRQYRPDFFYPDASLYHEHFALGERGLPPDHFDGDYVAGVRWKRQLHNEYGTSLFETTSDEIRRGIALDRLNDELVGRGLAVDFHPDREAPAAKPISAGEAARLLRVFQQHVKSNGLSREKLREIVRNQPGEAHLARMELFLAIYERVSNEWERRLGADDAIDFEDMMLLAAHHVEAGRYRSPFKVVLADEFQDSSRARIRLLKALSASHATPVHLCVVGDDWQGINRFAGADISVMTEFEKSFEHATRLGLTTTFRSPQSLCEVSSAFVMANPAQITKKVKSTNLYEKPSLLAFGFDDLANAPGHLEDQLSKMHGFLEAGKLEPGRDGRTSVLILGRYRDDRPRSLRHWQGRFGDRLDIDFRTIHASKGLEADYIIILNMVEGTRGFPSQIEDDPLLQLAMPAPDPYPMAEERRLFYVALTRARRQVRIYTSLAKPSRFVVELAKSEALVIKAVDGEQPVACPKCHFGVLVRRQGTHGVFESCSTWPGCDFTRNPSNGKGAAPRWSRLGNSVRVGNRCPGCGEGTMVERDGPYSRFLGCSAFPDCKTTARIE